MVQSRLLKARTIPLVAKQTVITLRMATFESFDISNVKIWQHIDETLQVIMGFILSSTNIPQTEKTKMIPQIDKLVQIIKRTLPTLLLSDFGIDLVLALYKRGTIEQTEPEHHEAVQQLIRTLPSDYPRILIRKPETSSAKPSLTSSGGAPAPKRSLSRIIHSSRNS